MALNIPTAVAGPQDGPETVAAGPDKVPAQRQSRLANLLLALGLLLTTASQFRLSGVPLGPGELCLLGWLARMLTLGLAGGGWSLTPALSRLILFWVIFVLAQSLGLLVGLSLEFGYDPEWLLHDVFAYPLLAAVSCLSVVDPGARSRQGDVCWLVVTLGALSLSVQIAAGWGVIAVPGLEPWFWERFRGWSSNPNQLALLCAVLGLLSLYLADSSRGLARRALAIVCAIPAIVAGRMTLSDTFSLVLLAAGPIYLGFKLLEVLLQRQRTRFLPTALLQILLLALPLAVASLAPIAYVTASNAGALVGTFAKNGGKEVGEETDLRLSLWTQAVKLGLKSGMMGVGPGPHLEIPASILAARRRTLDQPDHLEHPQERISEPNFEAHNSFLDLLTQGGIIAVLDFTCILFAAGLNAYRTRNIGLVTVISCLVIFCLTGLYIRHPIFWFTITLCLVQDRQSEGVRSSDKPKPALWTLANLARA